MSETSTILRSDLEAPAATAVAPEGQHTVSLFGLQFYGAGLSAAADEVIQAAMQSQSGYGCLVNAHMVAERSSSAELDAAMQQARWLFPDGKPVAMMSRWRGACRNPHIPGEALCLEVLQRAANQGIPIYLYGGSNEVLAILTDQLPRRFPGLVIAGYHSPPFRPLSESERELIIENIQESGAKICLAALGCPKQEIWMHQQRNSLDCVMLGVGAAFPMMAGTIPRAPKWLSHMGMEWFFRFCQEPRRLLRRYFVGNFMFLCAAIKDIATRGS